VDFAVLCSLYLPLKCRRSAVFPIDSGGQGVRYVVVRAHSRTFTDVRDKPAVIERSFTSPIVTVR
jgi:hypothetical protein